jgi:hypothetical protein
VFAKPNQSNGSESKDWLTILCIPQQSTKTSYSCTAPTRHPLGSAKIFTGRSKPISSQPDSYQAAVWQAAMLGILGGATAAVTLIEAFARACNLNRSFIARVIVAKC